MINYLFSDMDGTILNSKGKVSIDTILALNESDLPLSLVSARAPMEMQDTITKLAPNDIHVAFNGGFIFKVNNGKIEVLHKKYLQFSVAREIILSLREEFPTLCISIYNENSWNTDKTDEEILFEKNLTKQEYNLVNFKNYFNSYKEVFKIMIISFDDNEMKNVEEFLSNYSDYDISIQKSGQNYLEITHSSAKKSAAINYIKLLNCLKNEETLAFGDGHNDIPMFQCVGHRVVMGNAEDDVKEYADFITKDNNHNGIKYALKKYVRKIDRSTHVSGTTFRKNIRTT